jgi:6-phospho 3-hexuloisomerase
MSKSSTLLDRRGNVGIMTRRSSHPSVYDAIGGIILDKTACVLKNARWDEFLGLVQTVKAMDRIFVTGSGRRRLVGRFFVMRLVHLGKSAFVVGDTTTPAIEESDLLIAISGSGNTPGVVNLVLQAKREGARVACICLKNNDVACAIAEHSDFRIRLERRCDEEQRQSYRSDQSMKLPNITPMGTIYELSALFYFEAVVAEIIKENDVPESDMKRRHANLE